MNLLALYHKCIKLPCGHALFSKLVCIKAPYFNSIKPRITDLKANYCQVTIKKRRRVTNHLNTVHAIAMCNMAELAAGLMTDASIAKTHRWIPKAMQVNYLKKAKSDLVAKANGEDIDWNKEGDVIVHVDVIDKEQTIVFNADITMNLKLKPKR